MQRLTVLLPARNAERTIRTAVSSVLHALPDGGTVLVLNDASDDTTGVVLAEMARRDRRIDILTSDAPLGVAGALNRLLEAAETPYVARMDADDITLPWRFVGQFRALEREGLDVVFSPVVMFRPSRFRVEPQPPLATGPMGAPYELLLNSAFIHPTMLGRRDVLLRAGGYRSVRAEDWDLFMRMALRGDRIGRIAAPSLLYRRHADQVTASAMWNSAHEAEMLSAQVHQELSKHVLGFGEARTYLALSGPAAYASDIAAALDLIDAVRGAARELPLRERVSLRATALISQRNLGRVYGVSSGARLARRST